MFYCSVPPFALFPCRRVSFADTVHLLAVDTELIQLVPLDDGTRQYEGEVEFVSSAEYSEDGRPMLASRPDTALLCTGGGLKRRIRQIK